MSDKIKLKDLEEALVQEIGTGDNGLEDEMKRAEELEIITRVGDNRKEANARVVRDVLDGVSKLVAAVAGAGLGYLGLKESRRLADITAYIEREGTMTSKNWMRVKEVFDRAMRAIK